MTRLAMVNTMEMRMEAWVWPDLPYDCWQPTRDTLHMYLQVIGKVRLALTPPSEP
jgi:Family of unknown function (DUF5996)